MALLQICALLQIFLPIHENRELLTHVIATKFMTQMRDMSMTIYYSEQHRPDKVNYYDIKTFCVTVQYATCLYMRVLNSCTDTVEILCLDEAKIERHINRNYFF